MPFPFLRLPAELRNEIYHQLLVYPDPVVQDPSDEVPPDPENPYSRNGFPGFTPSLVFTNRQVHAEAASIFYGFNTFTLSSSDDFAHFPRMGPKNVRYIRRLIIDGASRWSSGIEMFLGQRGLRYGKANRLLMSPGERWEMLPMAVKEWWEAAARQLSAVIRAVAKLCCRLELFDVRFYDHGMGELVTLLARASVLLENRDIFLARPDIRQAMQAVKCVRGTLALRVKEDFAPCEEVVRAMGGVEKLVVTWPCTTTSEKEGVERRERYGAEGWDILIQRQGYCGEYFTAHGTKVLGLPAVENYEVEMHEAPADAGKIRAPILGPYGTIRPRKAPTVIIDASTRLVQVASLDSAADSRRSWRRFLGFDYWSAAMSRPISRSKGAAGVRSFTLRGKLIKRDSKVSS